MSLKASVKISRDLEVVQIPEGYKVRLARGTGVQVMQALGDTFTVMTEYGTMVRIAGKDADAIGEVDPTVAAGPAVTAGTAGAAGAAVTADLPLTAEDVKERVWTALRGVYDPEIPVNVVELGLVYNNDVIPIPEGGYQVDVKMTLTAPGCGMGDVLKEDAARRIRAIPQVKVANVLMVVEPVWGAHLMSEAAKLQLGI
jgi:probable FeS assembly SUF system protein SufT